MLGPNAHRNLIAGSEGGHPVGYDLIRAVQHCTLSIRRDPCRQRVHRRRTDESGHKHGGGLCIDIGRRDDLLGHAAIHHNEPVGEGHRLDLVMRNVAAGRAQIALKPLVGSIGLPSLTFVAADGRRVNLARRMIG